MRPTRTLISFAKKLATGGRGVKEELSLGVAGASLNAHNCALHKTPSANLPQPPRPHSEGEGAFYDPSTGRFLSIIVAGTRSGGYGHGGGSNNPVGVGGSDGPSIAPVVPVANGGGYIVAGCVRLVPDA
ncbi:MAG: hypothetical protein KIT74_05810, partial [Fimbriimonadales bacterium]|nr:hypothetical protein [Fimbriimonadales bacterium]